MEEVSSHFRVNAKSMHVMVLTISSRGVTVRPERKENPCTRGWPHPRITCSCFLSNRHCFLCNSLPWNDKFLNISTQISLASTKRFCSVYSLRFVFMFSGWEGNSWFSSFPSKFLIGILWQYFCVWSYSKLGESHYINIMINWVSQKKTKKDFISYIYFK